MTSIDVEQIVDNLDYYLTQKHKLPPNAKYTILSLAAKRQLQDIEDEVYGVEEIEEADNFDDFEEMDTDSDLQDEQYDEDLTEIDLENDISNTLGLDEDIDLPETEQKAKPSLPHERNKNTEATKYSEPVQNQPVTTPTTPAPLPNNEPVAAPTSKIDFDAMIANEKKRMPMKRGPKPKAPSRLDG